MTSGSSPPGYIDFSKTESMWYKRFICPPVVCCMSCSGPLVVHNRPVKVIVYTLRGPVRSTKVSLRCNKCLRNYNNTMFGRKNSVGEQFYAQERPLVEVSDTVFVERSMHELFCSLRYVYKIILAKHKYNVLSIVIIFRISVHCWVSFSGFAEVYFDYCSKGFSQ